MPMQTREWLKYLHCFFCNVELKSIFTNTYCYISFHKFENILALCAENSSFCSNLATKTILFCFLVNSITVYRQKDYLTSSLGWSISGHLSSIRTCQLSPKRSLVGSGAWTYDSLNCQWEVVSAWPWPLDHWWQCLINASVYEI